MSPVQVYFPTCVFCNPGESFDFEFVLTPRYELGMFLVYRTQYVVSLKRVSGLRNIYIGYPATGLYLYLYL